jgi:hypothetical protein
MSSITIEHYPQTVVSGQWYAMVLKNNTNSTVVANISGFVEKTLTLPANSTYVFYFQAPYVNDFSNIELKVSCGDKNQTITLSVIPANIYFTFRLLQVITALAFLLWFVMFLENVLRKVRERKQVAV